MAKNKLALDKLASELFADITRSDLSLKIRPRVLAPLMALAGFQNQCKGFYHHLFTATATLSFMAISRLFDPPHGRLSVTLEDLVDRVEREKAGHHSIPGEAAAFRSRIKGVREKIAKARGNVFAHKSYLEAVPNVVWADLESAHDEAKRILTWYGSCFGHAYMFRVPGYDQDCQRFVDAQKSVNWMSTR